MKDKAFLKLGDIKELYDDYCQNIGVKSDTKEFKAFLDYLKIDLYDWVRGTLRYFEKTTKYRLESVKYP